MSDLRFSLSINMVDGHMSYYYYNKLNILEINDKYYSNISNSN